MNIVRECRGGLGILILEEKGGVLHVILMEAPPRPAESEPEF